MMNKKLKGGILVFLGACSFGVLSTIVKTAYGEGFVVGEITGSQTFFGFLFLWMIYFVQNKFFGVTSLKKETEQNSNKGVTPKWKVVVAGSFTGLVGIFYYQSVSYIPASIAIILLMQYIWISMLIEWVMFKKRPHKIQLLAAAIVFIGTLFAGGILNDSLTLNTKGVLFGLLAAFSYAMFLLTSGRVGNEYTDTKKSALIMTGSMITTWIIFPPTFLISGVLFSGGLLKWGVVLALLGAVIPPLFFAIGIPKVGVSMGSILSAAELPVAVLSSYFILQEEVKALQWFGVLLILSAILITNIKFKKK